METVVFNYTFKNLKDKEPTDVYWMIRLGNLWVHSIVYSGWGGEVSSVKLTRRAFGNKFYKEQLNKAKEVAKLCNGELIRFDVFETKEKGE